MGYCCCWVFFFFLNRKEEILAWVCVLFLKYLGRTAPLLCSSICCLFIAEKHNRNLINDWNDFIFLLICRFPKLEWLLRLSLCDWWKLFWFPFFKNKQIILFFFFYNCLAALMEWAISCLNQMIIYQYALILHAEHPMFVIVALFPMKCTRLKWWFKSIDVECHQKQAFLDVINTDV